MANHVIASLPNITGDGLFTVNSVVPNTDGGLFSPLGSAPSDSYSYPLMDTAAIIGTEGHPYMNVGLPAYISTLYENTYYINSNLKNSISAAAVDNREYPTSYAVQQYVHTQIAGTQIINGSGTNNTYLVNTTVANTIIMTANTNANGFSYSEGANIKTIALYWMDTSANPARNGASKTVMYAALDHLKTSSGVVTGNLAFLYAGDTSHFLHSGVPKKYYQFVTRCDFLDFIQSYNSTTNSWEWIVKDSLGVFSNSIDVGSSISDTNTSMDIPLYGITGLSLNP